MIRLGRLGNASKITDGGPNNPSLAQWDMYYRVALECSVAQQPCSHPSGGDSNNYGAIDRTAELLAHDGRDAGC